MLTLHIPGCGRVSARVNRIWPAQRRSGLTAAALLVVAAVVSAGLWPAGAQAQLPGSASPPLFSLFGHHQAKLLPDDGAQFDQFGWSVAVSGDTALVGAYWHGTAVGATAGSAYVYVRSGGKWSLQQKLAAADSAGGDNFGYSVALSGDTALVGAYGKDSQRGAAYVFVRSGSTWTQQAKLVSLRPKADDYLGWSVALSGDTAVIGAPHTDTLSPDSNDGGAWVFVRDGAAWTLQELLWASDRAQSAWFGDAVAVSGDTILVGADRHALGGVDNTGVAYVFQRSGTDWLEQQELTAIVPAVDDFFGCSVAVAGNTALVGARARGAQTGSAYVFGRKGTVWSAPQRLTSSDGAAGDSFGGSVALANGTAVIGAPWAPSPANVDAGAAYVFARSGGTWTQQSKIKPKSDSASAGGFGVSVSLSGSTAVVGVPFYDGAAVDSGAADVYVLTSLSKIGTIKPGKVALGDFVTIIGTDFGSKGSGCCVKFGRVKATKYVSWSPTRIKCRVPARAKVGSVKVRVITAAGTSRAKTIWVRK